MVRRDLLVMAMLCSSMLRIVAKISIFGIEVRSSSGGLVLQC